MNLNKAIINEPYITHLIANSCIMTVYNCKKGYWHQELNEASSFLTTFNTEFGRFWYTVMPFGITIAGDIFWWKLDQCFSHLKNVIVIADDIMVVGKSPKEHDLAFTTLLEMEVDFFGETYTIDGCKPAQTEVFAITAMLELSCKNEVQSFIGMINYLSKFSARLSELSEPIRELSEERVLFNWGPEHRGAFNVLKKELVKAPILAYYDPQCRNGLATDNSIKGLGTCLL